MQRTFVQRPSVKQRGTRPVLSRSYHPDTSPRYTTTLVSGTSQDVTHVQCLISISLRREQEDEVIRKVCTCTSCVYSIFILLLLLLSLPLPSSSRPPYAVGVIGTSQLYSIHSSVMLAFTPQVCQTSVQKNAPSLSLPLFRSLPPSPCSS